MAKQYLDENGVLYFWQKIKTYVGNKVPTKTSDLTNDSGYITGSDIPEGAAASTTTPKQDGTASTGTEMAFARGDHVHPTDTSRAPLESPNFTGTPKAPTASASTNNTQIATTAFVKTAVSNGVSNLAPKANPAFTGTPTAPTATAGTNSTQIATTAFVGTAVTNALSGITGISYSVVESLPASGTAGVIYLVSNSGTGSNSYDEYIYVNNAFEKIGTTDVDLSAYMKTADMTAIENTTIDTITAS